MKMASESEKEGDNMEIYDDSLAVVIERLRDLMGKRKQTEDE